MSDEKRVGRTVRLTADINQRLIELCEHLGTNPNAYLVNEIGKAIARDEVAFRATRQTQGMMELLQGIAQGAQEGSEDA